MAALIQALGAVPAELATVLLAALPVAELRGALPVAVLVYQLPLPVAFILSVVGNMLPVYFLLTFLERASAWLGAHSAVMNRFWRWLFERTRVRLQDQVKRHGVWALALFVAVPLPATGAWSGAVAAFVFGLPRRQAFLAILAGVVLAGVIVTLLTVGGFYTVQALQGG